MSTAAPIATLETWRPVPGFEGHYEVSDFGRVKSLARPIHNGRGVGFKRTFIMSAPISSTGYKMVGLFKNSVRFARSVHRLVALAFLPPPKCGQIEVNHKDSNRANSLLSNLEWVTPTGNALHARDNGRRRTRLTMGSAFEIKALRQSGMTLKQAGARFGVSESMACLVVNNKRWMPANVA